MALRKSRVLRNTFIPTKYKSDPHPTTHAVTLTSLLAIRERRLRPAGAGAASFAGGTESLAKRAASCTGRAATTPRVKRPASGLRAEPPRRLTQRADVEWCARGPLREARLGYSACFRERRG